MQIKSIQNNLHKKLNLRYGDNMKEEIYLTTFELINSYGFIKMMSIIWMPFTIAMILLYIYKKM